MEINVKSWVLLVVHIKNYGLCKALLSWAGWHLQPERSPQRQSWLQGQESSQAKRKAG